ncbi:TrbI F-type domain-containing protein [Rhodoferax sp.]|uniref:TrbI F-type domain-containing protein n=1 Tax=Rhodoferax sp. TaxID=50421 RepID=UPI0027773027|nr:TrbI F-type domain-containing protein [Rhodoferax sp.]
MTTRSAVMLCLVAATLAFLIALLVPRLTNGPRAARYAVVDLTGVVARVQEENVRTITSASTGEAAKKQAMERAAAFGNQVNAAVVNLSQECDCVILMREAVIAGAVEDLTPLLLAKLNLK